MKQRLTTKIGPLDGMAAKIRTLPAIARPVKSEQARQDMESKDPTKRRFVSSASAGDRHFEALRAAEKKEPSHPCMVRIADWPVCHMRCYHRHRCGAALASDLHFNIWGI